MIFSVSPDLSSAFIALSLSPACVYFLAARWKEPWRLRHLASLRSSSARSVLPCGVVARGSVSFSAISSLIVTLCVMHRSSAWLKRFAVTCSATALSYCWCSMKKSATRVRTSGGVSSPSSSLRPRRSSKSSARKQMSSALAIAPAFWYSCTALRGWLMLSKCRATSSMVDLPACSARFMSSASKPLSLASRTAWLKRSARSKNVSASRTLPRASCCRARW
mmetsp:Transcript_11492/g.40085  ORF Transcript_11492/g.40085 Transcript_11492/m.40085 type:complete len:221 (+) Transcript_11492:779-1441(+)